MFAGHLDRIKTLARIQSQFFWQGIVRDVREYVRSCHVYQKMAEREQLDAHQFKTLTSLPDLSKRITLGINRSGFWCLLYAVTWFGTSHSFDLITATVVGKFFFSRLKILLRFLLLSSMRILLIAHFRSSL